ncbi:MAG: TonB-dependent receptor, partial [Gemmatimonadota bacterium]
MTSFGRAHARAPRLLVMLGLVTGALWGRPAQGQSLISGSLRGQVKSTDSSAVIGAQITITNPIAGSGYTFFADRHGQFSLPLVLPATYDILAEQAGYQPVRKHGIVVRAGEQTRINFVLQRRPPPITAIEEVPASSHSQLSSGRWIGSEILGGDLEVMDFRQAVTDVSRDFSTVAPPRDGRPGYAQGSGGLPQSFSYFFVDGLEETFLRHPGSIAEPASAPLFPRNSLAGVTGYENTFDIEWSGAPGSTLAAQSRGGSHRFRFRPYLTFSSAALGGKSADNPADSSGTSIQGGAILSGSMASDSAQYLLGFNYETLEFPSANPWERDSTSFDGAAVSLRETLPVVAADTFGTNVSQFTVPTVRTFRGGNGFGRLDWQLSHSVGFFARFNFAKWKEQNPQLAEQLNSGVVTRLEGRDFSGAMGMTATLGRTADELRLGVRTSKRDWISPELPGTNLVAEAAAIGYSPLLPALFDQRSVDVSNTLLFAFGDHRVKFGVEASFGKWKQDYDFGANGIYTFGDLDAFGNGQGDFFQVVGPASVEFSTRDIGVFLQDVWTLTDAFQFQAGVRLDNQRLPDDEITVNSAWVAASGITPNSKPADGGNVAPRVGFVWDGQGESGWVIRGGGGLYYGRTSPALFSEAAIFDGTLNARRAQGTFATWPAVPDSVVAPVIGPRLTLFDDEYRVPRAAKFDLALSHAFAGRFTVEVAGSYHHSDFLPRRSDLNLLGSANGHTSEGRPIYGSLVKQGGMVSPAPGTNRRFSGFDMVSGILANGFSDYYAVTATVERKQLTGIGLRASYTFSRTSDNWMLGPTGDPEDQLTPFPEATIADDWADGRSDLDIPHRLVLTASYTVPGKAGLDVALRYRFRSGLPFTPGFRPGVDINGDGSGSNDPAFIDGAIAGTDK